MTTSSVRRTGADISDLRDLVAHDPVDRTLLTGETVGHEGLARVLNDFVDYWHDQLGAYAAHLDDAGQRLETAQSNYQSVDESAAESLSSLDSDTDSPRPRGREAAW